MNKKQAAFLISTLIVLALFISLGLGQLAENDNSNDGKLQVVATFYPLEYFAKEIGGEKVSVNSMVPYNAEVHSWQPSVSDILTADKADIILYNGAGLDIWFEEDVLPSLSTEGKTIKETTGGVKLMETDHEDEHENENDNEHEHDDLLYDPHTWISPFIAKQQAENIYKALIEFDSDNMDYYKTRWDILKSKFEELDNDYQTQLADKKKNDVFITHESLGYLAHRYNFQQHGVIGISADEQPSVSSIENLVTEMEEHEIFVVYIDPIYSDDYAQTLKNTLKERTGNDVNILKLYFMLGPQDGKDYFAQQEANLSNLKIGLEA